MIAGGLAVAVGVAANILNLIYKSKNHGYSKLQINK